MRIQFRLYNGWEIVEDFPGGYLVKASFGFKDGAHKMARRALNTLTP